MFQPHTTYKQLLSNPLLFAAVLCVVMIAVFSPVFSQSAEAQTYGCSADPRACFPNDDNGLASAKILCGACMRGTDTFASAVERGCLIPKPACTGRSVDKEGNIQGGSLFSGFVSGVVVGTLVEILEAINYMLTILVVWFAELFDAAIAVSLAGLSGIKAVTVGWTITRDIANIFFIFALLIIAIATILRLESYGAKQLLPKLIIIALLINFSLVIAFTVVDASNILALAFISEIGDPTVSQNIATVLQLGKMTDVKTLSSDKHTPIDPNKSLSQGFETVVKTQLNQPFTSDEGVVKVAPIEQNEPSATVIRFFWQATILILQLTLMFVFVAFSVMLLIRSVALIMIFVLAPLGFLASVLPSTRTYSNQWWHKLFQWSFFFPASAFMMYLAIAFGAQMSQTLSGGNHVINTGILFSYFATVAFLMGSLVVAKQMGAGGAAAAIGIGVGMAKSARGYAGRVSGRAAMRYGVGPAGAVAGWPLQQMGRIPFVGALVRPLAKPFAAMQRAGAGVRDKQYEDVKKKVGESKSGNLATRRTLTAPGAIRVFDEALIDKGQASIIPEKALRQHVQRFKQEKEFGKLRKIYAYDPSLAAEGETTPEGRAAKITQATQGLSADDIRTKTNAGAIGNAFVDDAILLTYGSQKLEASAETFGQKLAPALLGAFERLRDKNLDKILADAGRTRATMTPDDYRSSYDETVKQLSKENPDILKFVNRSQTINMAPAAPGTLNIADTIRISVKMMNDKAEQEAEDALRTREARRGGGAPSPVEITQ